ncbi:related to YHM2-Protein of the mitochondrial carrier family (MCF) [Phialocephala subalpina]|uniref:Related to YHM2-Protein of the mitochondrial carrier family (MCF) n=1 Tax=Phialocephala subalpina TaxID=576137 RepID=A0A1L7WHU4_9HELO|nr:related to YHM2-Protein of the mitochondrial carrier family (MCF) [Phialocephala subalpina]
MSTAKSTMSLDTANLALPKKKNLSWSNIAVGAGMNVFQVTTLGQPMEVTKTYVAANRNASLSEAIRVTWSRGGWRAFYQGLIPWAWLEATTKGAILVFSSSEIQYYSMKTFHVSPTIAATLGGIGGGAAQAYLTMGMTTCMKTVEVTRSKLANSGGYVPGTMETFFNILRTQGIRGVNKGVNAVALRQITGWASRMGIAKFTEGQIRKLGHIPASEKLSASQKIAASIVGGTLSCWNQPFEVIRVEMQSMTKTAQHIVKPTMISTTRRIYQEDGLKGFTRGVLPRIGVASWATVVMVAFGDMVKTKLNVAKA